MLDTFTWVLGLHAVAQAARAQEYPEVPEPEFKRFVFPTRERPADSAAANHTMSPRTLEELGIPRAFAAELEATFRAMGAVEGERVIGFTFRAPDGVVYALRASGASRRARAGEAGEAGKAA